MKVFLACASLLPSYGGPAYAVAKLATALAELGAEVGIWAPDQSAATAQILPATSSVQRLTGCAAEALARFGKTDVLHDNGIWLKHNHRIAELGAAGSIPRVVSTRGMLDPWALNHKRFRKRIAWWLYQRRDLSRAVCHHATAEAEARNLLRLNLGVRVFIVPDGVDVPARSVDMRIGQVGPTGGRKTKTALFMGRLHPVKGLPMLVEAWARVLPEGWKLNIAGPDEVGHRAELERLVLAAGLGRVISFAGPLEGQAKSSTFFGADLFIQPSHSESFGMAIAEALAHGLPVLTTTGTPWSLLTERDCGWWVEPAVGAIAEALRAATSLELAMLQAMGARGRTFVATEFGWGRIAMQHLRNYESLLAA